MKYPEKKFHSYARLKTKGHWHQLRAIAKISENHLDPEASFGNGECKNENPDVSLNKAKFVQRNKKTRKVVTIQHRVVDETDV